MNPQRTRERAREIVSRLRILERRLLRKIGEGFFGRLLRRDLIFPIERVAVSRGLAIGMFWGLFPMPFQMAPALVFCLLARANIVLAVACVWISNPFTYLPIFYFEYLLGRALFAGGGDTFSFADFKERLNDGWDGGAIFTAVFSDILAPLLQGALVSGMTMAVAGYFFGFSVYNFLHRHRKRNR